MKRISHLLILSSFGVFAQFAFGEPSAPPTTLAIKQVISTHHLVIVEMKGAAAVYPKGKIFIVTFADDRQCSLSLKETSGSLLTLDSSGCNRSDEISTKLAIEESLMSAPVADEESAKNEKIEPQQTRPETYPGLKANFYTNVYYSTANKILFSQDHKLNGGAVSLTSEFGTSASVGLGIGIAQMATYGLGYSLAWLYEPTREVDSVKFSGPGGTAVANFTGIKPKISFMAIEGNFIYRWDRFYLPFGANLSIPRISDTAPGETWTAKGALGLSLGMGVFVSPKVSFDASFRTIGVNLDMSDKTTTIDFGYGALGGLVLGGKFYF